MGELYNKALNADFESIMKRKNYAFFSKGDFNLNIIGIRSDNNNKVTNLYDDILVLLFKVNDKYRRYLYSITTEPGTYYMQKELGNSKGTAILVPGQYRGCWKIGKHNGKYDALVQQKPVKVYRDKNKDNVYDLDPKTIDEGVFGINIHRSNQNYERKTVDMYSAGCQVFSSPSCFDEFMEICNIQKERYSNNFTYTLLDEKDLY